LFLPSLIFLKLKDADEKQNIVLVSTVFLLTLSSGVGCMFKIMQWPYATLLITVNLIIFLVLFIPMYFIIMKRRAGKKFTTFINIVLMLVVGLMLFIMTL